METDIGTPISILIQTFNNVDQRVDMKKMDEYYDKTMQPVILRAM
jgi:hypothetical protein